MSIKDIFGYLILLALIFVNIGNSSCYLVVGDGLFYQKKDIDNVKLNDKLLEINRSFFLDSIDNALKISPQGSFGNTELLKLKKLYSEEIENYMIKETLFYKLKKDYPNCGFEKALK